MEERKEPTVAPGQELTVHPGDEVRGADLLEEQERTRTEVATEPVPDLRRAQDTGGVAWAATQEPEFETAVTPDGRSADPRGAFRERTFLGAVTQDDPIPTGLDLYPTPTAEGDITLVAVFEDITGARSCADDLERRGIEVETTLLPRRGDGPEQGLRPGNVITGPGYGLSAPEDQSPPKNPEMGAGVAVGATIGATAGLLAATYIIPQFGTTLVGTVTATGTMVSTLAGAGIGAFLGGLVQYGTNEQQDGDDATIYAGQVRRGGVLLLARADAEHVDEVRQAIAIWNPLEIRVQ